MQTSHESAFGRDTTTRGKKNWDSGKVEIVLKPKAGNVFVLFAEMFKMFVLAGEGS